jgi:hypothetical protein
MEKSRRHFLRAGTGQQVPSCRHGLGGANHEETVQAATAMRVPRQVLRQPCCADDQEDRRSLAKWLERLIGPRRRGWGQNVGLSGTMSRRFIDPDHLSRSAA